MLQKMWHLIRPAVFWSYGRGSWQYDIIVGLILAFIFVTPRTWFRDQPRMPGSQQIVMLRSDHGLAEFWIDRELILVQPQDAPEKRIRSLLEARTGKKMSLVKTELVRDSEGDLMGYLVHARF